MLERGEPINVDVRITDVSNKCIRHVKKTTEVIGLISHLLDGYSQTSFPILNVDALAIGFNDPEETTLNKLPKDKALDWLFKKAFEEFIVGITESLIEAHKVVKLSSLSEKTKVEILKREQIYVELEKINQRPLKLFLPILISEIEEEIKNNLLFKEEVLSINQVRNCLVHRNGRVTDKDVNDPASNVLKLIYSELVVMSEKNGKIIEVKKEHKNPGFSTNKIGIHTRKKETIFKNGEYVIIDATTFNNISLTCILFVTNLLEKIPLPEGTKSN